MSEHKFLYIYSLSEAVHNNEKDLWRESYKENCDCARAIEKAIAENYRDNILNDCAQPIIEKYGFNRVNWVLANTVLQNKEDGRFSEDNKIWARGFHIFREDVNWHFSVESHPGLTNIFINQARKAWQGLGLFDRTHCISVKDSETDYTNKVLILDPSVLKDEYKTPDDQLFLAEDGFGCHPNSRGRKVFGQFLKDGEETHFYREDFIGAIDEKYLPDWAAEKLNADKKLTVVMVEPHKAPYAAEVDDELSALQKAVGGYIEVVGNGDGTLIICNEEGKLKGLEGNRRIRDGMSIIAGTFFVVGEDGENFRSLDESEVARYMDRFAEPEDIGQDEVESDMGITFISM
ncbi:MAG: DUF3849 domain-containing protein [Acutalibacteraceae bacterium]|nr:DUF3849 domain-containing protein [Acutalibacteraceae bacterium]